MGTDIKEHVYENGDILILQGPDSIFVRVEELHVFVTRFKEVYTLSYGERVAGYSNVEDTGVKEEDYSFLMTNSELFLRLEDAIEAYDLRKESENPIMPIKTGKELKQ
jgi:hypothetical protein